VDVVSTLAPGFDHPYGVAVDGAGSVFVAETSALATRMITPGGVVTLLAGSVGVTGSTDGPAAAALFDHPQAVAVDAAGNVFVADTYNGTIRKISAAGMVTTVVGAAGCTRCPARTTAGHALPLRSACEPQVLTCRTGA
jgi:glucose/arabinose dehydrogenase